MSSPPSAPAVAADAVGHAAGMLPAAPPPIDSLAFARGRKSLAGVCALAGLHRLVEAGAAASGELHWEVDGSTGRDDQERSREFLEVRLSFAPTLACGRCLGPVQVDPLVVRSRFRLAATERQAEIEDRAESALDVLAHDRAFDLAALVEDEAILALPMFVAHRTCPDGDGDAVDV
jgi:uncharacterized protein